MQSAREEKQAYLVENVIGRNYDPEEFIEYCQDKQGGTDIDAWTLADVIRLVDQFVKQKNQQKRLSASDPFESVFNKGTNNTNDSEDFKRFGEGTTPEINKQNFEFDYDQPATTSTISFNAVDFDFLTGSYQPVVVPITKAEAMQNDLNSFNDLDSTKKDNKKMFNNMNVKKPQHSNVQTKPSPVFKSPQTKSISPSTKQQISKPPINQNKPVTEAIPAIVPIPIAVVANTSISKQVPALQSIKQTIACKKINPKQLLNSGSRPYVHIQNHQIVSPNMFVPNYVLYHIRVNPLGIQVRRRYKDFETLRELLYKLYPLSRLPFLNSNNRLSETEQSSIKRQKYMLESFINDMLLNKEFLSSKVVEQFLTIKDDSLYKKKFKDYQKLGQIKSIQDLATITGTYELFFTSKHYDFCQKVPPFLNVFEAYQQKIRTLYEQLSNSIQQSTKILHQISQTYSSFEQMIQNFNNSNSAVQTFMSLEGTYRSLSTLHKQWALSFSQQIKLIDNDIRPGLKFDKQNIIQTTKELLKIRTNISQNYLKRAQKESTTQKYNSSRLQGFKTELTSPSKNITVLKYQNAYVNSKAASEIGRLFRDLSFKLQQRYAIMGKLQSNISQNIKQVWSSWAAKAQ